MVDPIAVAVAQAFCTFYRDAFSGDVAIEPRLIQSIPYPVPSR